jgi:hypothetical protein
VDIIQHAHVIPWSIDSAFLLTMAALAARAVGLLAFVAPVYAVVYRLLSNRHRAGSAEGGPRQTTASQFSQ